MAAPDPRRTVEAIWRIESARLIAGLARIVRDVGLAEELAQDALVAALEQWPESGIPDNPGAWLMATGKHHAIDLLRRGKRVERKHEELSQEIEAERALSAPDLGAALDEEVGDDLLRLVFTACHPVLPTEARVALTLRLLGGLTTEEIARAFLVPEGTVAQRIVRAKRTLAEARVPFEVPRGEEITARLSSVLEVIYLVFNEGYSASSGDSVTRPDLSGEAIRLGRLLVELLPDPEAVGLLALMLLQESRRAARSSATGDLILLEDQDRSLWNREEIAEGTALAQRALSSPQAGAYTLQAAIAAAHAEAAIAAATDWARIVGFYDKLVQVAPSPVVELNRAVALAMRDGAEAGLRLIDAILGDGELVDYHLAHAARADLCRRLGRMAEARTAYRAALALSRQGPEQRFLERRLAEVA